MIHTNLFNNNIGVEKINFDDYPRSIEEYYPFDILWDATEETLHSLFFQLTNLYNQHHRIDNSTLKTLVDNIIVKGLNSILISSPEDVYRILQLDCNEFDEARESIMEHAYYMSSWRVFIDLQDWAPQGSVDEISRALNLHATNPWRVYEYCKEERRINLCIAQTDGGVTYCLKSPQVKRGMCILDTLNMASSEDPVSIYSIEHTNKTKSYKPYYSFINLGDLRFD